MTFNSRRIASVVAEPGFRFAIIWQDGGRAVVDMTNVVQKLPYFAALTAETEFAQVPVIGHSTGVEWANGIDYSADSLEMLAAEQADMTGDDLRSWKQEMQLSLNKTADIFGISVSAVKNYLSGQQPVPIALQIACAAMRRDRNILYARFRPRVAGRPNTNRRNEIVATG